MDFYFGANHSRTLPSWLADARVWPSGAKARPVTKSLCQSIVNQLLSGGDMPKLDEVVVGACCQSGAVGREGQGAHDARVAVQAR